MPISHPTFESLARDFERNTVFQYMHPYELYRKWLEAVWAFLNAAHDPDAYKTCLDAYTFEQGQEFGRLFGLYTDLVDALPFHDILGSLFMQLDVKSASSGQFFSPYEIAEMMARMQFDKDLFLARVQEKGVVTVLDPAVGSGVMLLAFAKVVFAELGPDGLNHLQFYGTDIDHRCVLMCRIQLRMNGLDEVGRMARLTHSDTPAPAHPAGQMMLALTDGQAA
jgi:hypothetical protein